MSALGHNRTLTRLHPDVRFGEINCLGGAGGQRHLSQRCLTSRHAEQIKGKLISVKAAGEAVANGEAEIGFTQISEVLPYAGAEVGGMLPPDVQSFTNFSIGIREKDFAPAEALVKFLTTPAAAAVIKLKGLEPL